MCLFRSLIFLFPLQLIVCLYMYFINILRCLSRLLFQEIVPPVQQAVLEILPLIRPTEHLSSMWSLLLRELLYFLLGFEAPSLEMKDETEVTSNVNQISVGVELGSHVGISLKHNGGDSGIIRREIQMNQKPVFLDVASISMTKAGTSSPRAGEVPSYDMMAFSWSHLFAEKLVPIIVELFLEAPPIERCNVFPEVIQGLGR